ncbi:disease resistance protein Pik-2-like isoform X1 [Miscanthus floridulus]|uniref:disease resistance protein Pik-2-like isoform X1 n=1 Tax=Miscanthus floridulus TaxID=154761 RepID=UPI003459B6E3
MEAIVVTAAEGAVKTLLGKLGSVLAQQNQLVGGVRGELQYIKDELESMNAFLQNLATANSHDVQVKIWMKQVREMAYDAEDCIDEFQHHFGGSRGDGIMGFLRRMKYILSALNARHRIVMQVQELKNRAQDVSDRYARYSGANAIAAASGLQGSAISTSNCLALDPRQAIGFIQEGLLVGIDKRRNRLLKYIMEDYGKQLRVISIFGFGGLGKTTIAKAICDSPQSKSGQFQCQAFVTVSQKFDLKAILRDILGQLIPHGSNQHVNSDILDIQDEQLEGFEVWDVKRLGDKLRSYLDDKRYLIVFDDIWSDSAWDNFKFFLPRNHFGSVIIVTTRIRSVANYCSHLKHDCSYEIEPLNQIEAKELFFRRLFGQVDVCPQNLQKVSEDILKKCGGMPLAINSITGILASRAVKSLVEWQTLHNSLGSELDNASTMEKVKHVLLLSYSDLPYHLKTCFLYFSIFPEDYKIRRKNVIQRWVAEGFVSEKRGLSAEQVAESYFAEFINRSIIQPIDISDSGKVKTCRIHDVMLEVIVGLSVEQNFVSLMGDQYVRTSHDKVRRVSLHGSGSYNLSTSLELSHVRSLSSFGDMPGVVCFNKARFLRVVDLENCEFLRNHHLKQICALFQLKFLSLRNGHNINRLPRNIRNLKSLKTLDLRGTCVDELPGSLTELKHLEHFRSGYTYLPFGFGKMKSIQSLGLIEISDDTSWRIQEIECLVQLKKLRIRSRNGLNKENWESLLAVIEKLSRSLVSLSIETDGRTFCLPLDFASSPPLLLQSFLLYEKLEALPSWVASLDNLVKLTLGGTQLKDDDIQVLQKLPRLFSLRLWFAFATKHFVVGCSGFPNLQLLAIQGWDGPLEMTLEEGSMQKLHKLVLVVAYRSSTLKSVKGVRYLQSLQTVEIRGKSTEPMEALLQEFRAEASHLPHHPTVIFKKV